MNTDKSKSEYLAISELTKEIGTVVSKCFDEGEDLNKDEIEHILKMTTDVTLKIKSPAKGVDCMNKCHDRHESTYKIKYKPLSPKQPSPEWYVL